MHSAEGLQKQKKLKKSEVTAPLTKKVVDEIDPQLILTVSGYQQNLADSIQDEYPLTPYYVVIQNVGPSHRNVCVNISSFRGVSGFITMGDHNLRDSAGILTL